MTDEINPDEYNGWVNHETWATALHLGNDEGLYRCCVELVDSAEGNIFVAADMLKTWVEEEVEVLFHPYTIEANSRYPAVTETAPEWVRLMVCDVGSFHRVNWVDVAESFVEE